MGKIRRKFDVSFKIQVCQRLEAGLQHMTEVCHENQLQRTVVEGWVRRYAAGTLISKVNDRQKELERENEKLKSKIGELTMTIDLLKKVEAWKKQQTSAASSIITSRNLAQFQRHANPLASPSPATTTNPRRAR